VFDVELRRNAGRKQGRAARRTAVRKAWFETQETGQDWVEKPRFNPSSLGAGGYAVGGWVLVNDALQLGLDLARYFELRSAPAVGSALSTLIAVENLKYVRSSQRLPLRGSGLFPRKVHPWMP
jgi:hypothetical protein